MGSEAKAGRWVLAIARHLEAFRASRERTYFEKTITAAKCGLLLGRMRRLERIEWPRLTAMAQEMGIGEDELRLIILPRLQKARLIEINHDAEGIREVYEYASTADAALEDLGRLWYASDPSDVERAVVTSLELCSLRPQSLTEYSNALAKEGFLERTVKLARDLQRSYQLLQEAHIDGIKEPFLYNEYLWGSRISQSAKFFSCLPPEVKDYVASLLELVRSKQGHPVSLISDHIPKKIIVEAERAGLIDTTQVTTQDGRKELFAFSPHLYGVQLGKSFVDIFDEVKLFVASIMYGHRFASYRIKDPVVLVEALLRNREVGPASPIGSDYPLIETAGIVKVEKSKHYANRYYMKLVKDDVVEQGLAVLKKGFVEGSGRYTRDSSGLYLPGDFQGPEEHRTHVALAQASQVSLLARERIIRAMRGEEL